MLIHWAAVCFAWLLGIALQLQQAFVAGFQWAGTVLALAAGMGACLLVWRRTAWLQSHGWLLWCVFAASLGWGQTEWRATQRLQQGWPASWAKEVVELTGRIDSLPQRRDWGTAMEVEVLEVAYQGQRWRAGQLWDANDAAQGVCPSRIALRDSGERLTNKSRAQTSFVPGQTWRWQVQLHAIDGQLNPGGFDREQWMFAQGLRAQGKVHRPTRGMSSAAATLLHEPTFMSEGWVDRWRLRVRDRVQAHVPDPRVAGLVLGLTIGDQSAIGQDDWLVLRATGVAHLVSISGLHITMMGWLVAACVGACWRRSITLMHFLPKPTASRWAGLIGAGLYALVAGWGVPAQRTVLMLAVIAVLHSTGRRWPWPLVLLLAAVAVTALDPWALTQAGFWLSFAAVGLLMLAGEQDHTSAGMSWVQRARAALWGLWRTQSVASFGLAPLSLVFFQTVSVLGFAANLLCIPLFTVLITPLALLGCVAPWCWQVLTPLVQCTMAALAWLAQSPWAVAQGASVSWWAASLGLLAGGWMLVPLPWRWRLLAWPGLLPLLWPTAMSQLLPPPAQGDVQVLAVDIGQGTSVLVRTARHALLYDTGPRLSDEADAGQRILVGLLRAVNVRQLDELLISHGDMDHIGGAPAVMRAVPVQHLRSSLTAEHELLSSHSPSVGLPKHTPCEAGQQWTWDGVRFEVLYPTADDLARRLELGDNALSCVIRVQANGQSVLLTGDIESDQEAALLSRSPQALRSDVLIVPHHGSKTSSTDAFLQAVSPRVAVIQAGARNRYGHPHASVLARYDALRIPVVQTPQCGAWLWLASADQAFAPGQCWRDLSRRYWHGANMPDMGDETHQIGRDLPSP